MSYKEMTTASLREILNSGVARFNFRKKDGSIRNALGTRNVDLIPREDAPVQIYDLSRKAMVYWDLELGEFRSLSEGTEVGVAAL